MKTIVVNATALVKGGGLSILKQFLTNADSQNHYHIFCNDKVMGLPKRKNFVFHKIARMNSFRRVHWDIIGLKRYISKINLKADVVISLQNTTINAPCNLQIVYVHQGIPFSNHEWSFWRKNERKYAFYKYIYPIFIFLFDSPKVNYIVQTKWMKEAIINKTRVNSNRIKNIKPDITYPSGTRHFEVDKSDNTVSFFYPASSEIFKNHMLIIESLGHLKASCKDLSNVVVYFTIEQYSNTELADRVNALGLNDCVRFLGELSYQDVIKLYLESNYILFPSKIESFGLPLLEAAYFGKRILAIDADYAKEVLIGYKGVIYIKDEFVLWSTAIYKKITDIEYDLESFKPTYNTGWRTFFNLISQSERE